jgi:predicted RecB family endonuclease
MTRIKSLKDAVQQAIDRGATTAEDVYLRVSRLPFDQLERIAALEGVVRKARGRHDQSVARLYATIRAINRRVGQLADQALRRLGLAPAAPRRARKAKKR